MAEHPGNNLRYGPVETLEECQKFCEEDKYCNSIEYKSGCGKNVCKNGSNYCWTYDKCLIDSEPHLKRNYMGFRAYYKDCNGKFFN